MSSLKVDYAALRSSANWARKNEKALISYASELERRVITPLGNLPGADASGYASSAATCARKRINALNATAGRYGRYAAGLDKFTVFAREADKKAANAIARVSASVIGKRPWLKSIIDTVYKLLFPITFKKILIGKMLLSFIKTAAQKTWNIFIRIVKWFKTGNGKYILNFGFSAIRATVLGLGAISAIIALAFNIGANFPMVLGLIIAAAIVIIATISITKHSPAIEEEVTVTPSGKEPPPIDVSGKLPEEKEVKIEPEYEKKTLPPWTKSQKTQDDRYRSYYIAEDGEPGAVFIWNYEKVDQQLSCTYYTLRKLRERGLGFPFKVTGQANGNEWYDNCADVDGVKKYEGTDALKNIMEDKTLKKPVKNVVVSLGKIDGTNHVVLIDEIYEKEGEDGKKYFEMTYSDMNPDITTMNGSNAQETVKLDKYLETNNTKQKIIGAVVIEPEIIKNPE